MLTIGTDLLLPSPITEMGQECLRSESYGRDEERTEAKTVAGGIPFGGYVLRPAMVLRK